jgi:hypothetical protein
MTEYPSPDNFRHPENFPEPLALNFVVSCYDLKSSTYGSRSPLLDSQRVVFNNNATEKVLRDLFQVCT